MLKQSGKSSPTVSGRFSTLLDTHKKNGMKSSGSCSIRLIEMAKTSVHYLINRQEISEAFEIKRINKFYV